MNILKRVDILGYLVLNEPAVKVANAICDGLESNQSNSIIFLNPHSIELADSDPVFRKAILNAFGIFCDGVGLSIASLILNRVRIQRVYGFEFFEVLSKTLSSRQIGRVFFLGADTECLVKLQQKYKLQFPGILSIDFYAPPHRKAFTDREIGEMARRISESSTNILWVGLGSPKQEKVLHQLMETCNIRCGAAIGAVFDFYSGRIPHSPAWVRHCGLQWAHRLALEPRRLWKRTFVSMPKFLYRIFRNLLSS